MNPDDLHALRRGDAAAWERAYPTIYASARAAVYAVLAGACESELQDICIRIVTKVAERLPKYPDIATEQELKAFTVSIAYDRAYDHLRRHLASKRGSGRVESLDGNVDAARQVRDENAPEPDTELMTRERAEFVSELLTKLKPMEFRILYGSFFLGQTHAEIADDTGLKRGSVGVYLRRALDATRDYLGRHPALMSAARALVGSPVLVLFLLKL